MAPNQVTPAGLEYGPTANGKMYLSVYKHRGSGSRRDKNMWSSDISHDTEYDIFCFADEHNLYDNSWNYWGVWEKGQAILGEKGERVSKFPSTSNQQDPWHGYPVSLVEERRRKALPRDFDLLVENWIRDEIITKEVGRKIQKEKI